MTKIKVLLIDDNPSDRALALREIKKLFPEVESSEIGDQPGLEGVLAQPDFDIVITDYQLRWTNGLKVLHAIKEVMPYCPVIMFTGTGSEEIAVEAMKAGLDDYVIKSPHHYVRLASAVRNVWEKVQQQQALQEAKTLYRRLFENAPIGLYRLNTDGKIIEANSTLIKLLGYSEQQNILDSSFKDYHIDAETAQRWSNQLDSSGVVDNFESQIRRVDGVVIWVRHNVGAITASRGNILYYEGSVEDITERKRAEQERAELLEREQQAREEAQTNIRLKDEFLATLSHELKTPLNAIMGWVQLLRSGQLSQDQTSNAMSIIERNAQAQNQLIEDLLDVSRIIQGKLRLNLQPISLSVPIRAALDTVKPTAKAKKIEIQTALEPDHSQIRGDAERLQQVFWNLMINALKFTPANGQVTISLEYLEDAACVRIADTGQGIKPDILPYIFDRFRQADAKSTRTQGGLGLGLAIVRHLVEIHGGTVSAQSAGISQGTTFTVKLPLFQNSIDRDSSQSVCDQLPTLNNLNLLIVEDEPDAQQMLTLILEKYGAKITAVDSVEAALVELEKQDFDLLISDISMPIQDGYSLIRLIRQREKNHSRLGAIALTAYARDEDRKKAIAAGFDLHLSKPIEPIKLVEAVNSLSHLNHSL